MCCSWGYDLREGKLIRNPEGDQRWQRWPIRLYKMTRSLELFGKKQLHENAVKYGRELIRKGERFVYGGKNLAEYFMSGEEAKRESKTNIEGQKTNKN